MDDSLVIDNKYFRSRLLTGTGRHKNSRELIIVKIYSNAFKLPIVVRAAE